MIIKKDVAVIGAGPVGLFSVFELGLNGLSACVIDSSPLIGGQCIQFYPKKPIYDIPGLPEILGEDLINNLLKQINRFKPEFLLSEKVIDIIDNNADASNETCFHVKMDSGNIVECRAVLIATGAGLASPKLLSVDGVDLVNNIRYSADNKEKYKDRNVAILGGGDSAIDWTLHLYDICNLSLIHRRDIFKAVPSNVEMVLRLKEESKIEIIIDSVSSLSPIEGGKALMKFDKTEDKIFDDILVFYGFSIDTKMSYDSWGIKTTAKVIDVNIATYESNIKGIFAIGDANSYENKMKLILSGFHESAIASKKIYELLNPDKKYILKYTTMTLK